jgi:glycerate kinase
MRSNQILPRRGLVQALCARPGPDRRASYRTGVRVLIAPDKFRGTLTAPEAADAIAAGWRRSRPDDRLDRVPMADGGEGSLEAIGSSLGGERRTATVSGPLGDPVEAMFGLAGRGGRRVAIVESAMACGMQLLAPGQREPLRASTFGVGELLLAAGREGIDEALVCIGGSATTDGGAGMAQALGARLLDVAGRAIARGGEGLPDLATIDLRGIDRSVSSARVVAAADVDNPLVGPYGAAAEYAPQKGASPHDVALLERALAHLAAIVGRDIGVDVRDLPGGGAAGGMGAGLVAFLGARLRRGADVVMDVVGFDRRLAEADVVVTGEGRFDEQSRRGKVVGAVIERAARTRARVVILSGQATADAPGADVRSLSAVFGMDVATGQPRRALEELAADVAAGLEPISSER